MRDPNRLDALYEKIKEIHKREFPDWRMGQFMLNFMTWYAGKTRTDMFYVEDNKFTNALEDYIKEIKG